MKISGYSTSRNAKTMGYPFVEAIKSLFNIVDEIVICDTSNDIETKKSLKDLKSLFEVTENKKFSIIEPEVDWNAPNHGIYDGETKAIARKNCTGDYLIQLDLDEIFVGTRSQVEDMIKKGNLNKDNPVLALPVAEPWGSSGKIRVDINPWKERISLNDPNITHGIPNSHRKYINNLLFAEPGTDGCNLIYKNSGIVVPILNFVSTEINQIRNQAITNVSFVPIYEKWFNKITDKMPYIFHLSWWSVYQKMLKYKLFWNNSWNSLYGNQQPKDYNQFFNKSFTEITEQEMVIAALKIEEETSGHIFHAPYISGISPKTNSIILHKNIPNIVQNWCNDNKTEKFMYPNCPKCGRHDFGIDNKCPKCDNNLTRIIQNYDK